VKISLKGRPGKLSTHGKRKITESMYFKGKNFLRAAILLRKAGGYEYIVLYLLCQGIEITLKSFLLFHDYDKYKPRIKTRFRHDLEKLTVELLSIFGLNPIKPLLSDELHNLNMLYINHYLRYGSFYDVLVDPNTISSDRVLRRIVATLRLADRFLS